MFRLGGGGTEEMKGKRVCVVEDIRNRSSQVGAGHEAQVFKDCLDRMEENICRCGRTPSEVGEEFVSSEDEGRTELSYASARGDEYVDPPIKNLIPIPVPALATCCLGPSFTLPPMEEICHEYSCLPPRYHTFIRKFVT